MATYLIAKSNQTARAFVVRRALAESHWIVIDETNSYVDACRMRDEYNEAVRNAAR